MSTRLITNNWTVLKRRLKQKYTQLTAADLAYIESKDEELLDRLQQCLGMSRIEIAWLVEEITEDKRPVARPALSPFRNEE